MKYFVQVNIKYLVSLEADSALRAEHACLDLDGVWASHAFDPDSWKTETFRGALLDSSCISLEELADMSGGYRDAWRDVAVRKDAVSSANEEIRRLAELMDRAKAARDEAVKAHDIALKTAELNNHIIGMDLMNR